jgi:hypothetical protein
MKLRNELVISKRTGTAVTAEAKHDPLGLAEHRRGEETTTTRIYISNERDNREREILTDKAKISTRKRTKFKDF